MRMLARCIYDDAQPIKGTLAQTYFESRDLWSVAREVETSAFIRAARARKPSSPRSWSHALDRFASRHRRAANLPRCVAGSSARA